MPIRRSPRRRSVPKRFRSRRSTSHARKRSYGGLEMFSDLSKFACRWKYSSNETDEEYCIGTNQNMTNIVFETLKQSIKFVWVKLPNYNPERLTEVDVEVNKEYDVDERRKLFGDFCLRAIAKTRHGDPVRLVVRNSEFLNWFNQIPKNTMWRKFDRDSGEHEPTARTSPAEFLKRVDVIGKKRKDVFNVTNAKGPDLNGLQIGAWYSVNNEKYQFRKVLPSSIHELNLHTCSTKGMGFRLTVQQVNELCEIVYGCKR